MLSNMKSIITGCLVKFTGLADKVKEGLLTKEKSQDFLLILIDETCKRVWRRRIESFVTDN